MSVQFPTIQEMQPMFQSAEFSENQIQTLTTLFERISNVAQQNIVQAQERINTLEQENIQLIGRVQQLENTMNNGFTQLRNEMQKGFEDLRNSINAVNAQVFSNTQTLNEIRQLFNGIPGYERPQTAFQ